MSLISNAQLNRDKFVKLLKALPMATHVYFRREDTVLVDIPLAQTEYTITSRPSWSIEGLATRYGSVTLDEANETPRPQVAEDPVDVPPKPSEVAKAPPRHPWLSEAEPTPPEDDPFKIQNAPNAPTPEPPLPPRINAPFVPVARPTPTTRSTQTAPPVRRAPAPRNTKSKK